MPLASETEFIENWRDRWITLMDLVMETICPETKDASLITPCEDQELEYQILSSWFRSHEEQFLPLWQGFYTSQDWALDMEEELFSQLSQADDVLKNPFSVFYCSGSLGELQSSVIKQSKGHPDGSWDFVGDILCFNAIAVRFITAILEEN